MGQYLNGEKTSSASSVTKAVDHEDMDEITNMSREYSSEDSHQHIHQSTDYPTMHDIHDHSNMNHHKNIHAVPSADDTCSGTDHNSMHGMSMTFHSGYCETVLFQGWKISSINSMIGSFICITLMATMYEGVKYYRLHLFSKMLNSRQSKKIETPHNGEENVEAPHDDDDGENVEKSDGGEENVETEHVNQVVKPKMLSWLHAYQTFFHFLQIVLSYFLMLIFMTYNSWLCLAVALGSAFGYFLFGWKKSVVVDVTEHCH